jgi:hypothetical protein
MSCANAYVEDMSNTNPQDAVKAAITIYAKSLGVSFSEAVELFKTSQSSRECIGLLVLAQADPVKLRKMARK